MSKMKEMVKIVDNTKKHPEERQYLICYRAKEGSGENDDWEIAIGRTAAYNFIKENIDIIDLERSFVLVETLTLNDRKSIYAFMKYVGDMYEDNFDIDDYVKGDWDESDFKINNDIDPIIPNSERINMQSFMDGSVHVTELK